MESIPLYYFGPTEEYNYLHIYAPGMNRIQREEGKLFPFPWEMIYGDFCHTRKIDRGEITLVQVYGWTIISFWDNTLSPIPGVPYASSFIAPGSHSTMGILDLVVKHFPEVYRRVLPILKIREPNSPTQINSAS